MTIDSIIRYFDLASATRIQGAVGVARTTRPAPVVPQYLALLIGIVVQPFVEHYRNNHVWDLTGIWGWIPFAIITGLAIFPAVYKSVFDPDRPLFVQLCTIFTAGLGWQTLFQTAMKVATVASGTKPGQ